MQLHMRSLSIFTASAEDVPLETSPRPGSVLQSGSDTSPSLASMMAVEDSTQSEMTVESKYLGSVFIMESETSQKSALVVESNPNSALWTESKTTTKSASATESFSQTYLKSALMTESKTLSKSASGVECFNVKFNPESTSPSYFETTPDFETVVETQEAAKSASIAESYSPKCVLIDSEISPASALAGDFSFETSPTLVSTSNSGFETATSSSSVMEPETSVRHAEVTGMEVKIPSNSTSVVEMRPQTSPKSMNLSVAERQSETPPMPNLSPALSPSVDTLSVNAARDKDADDTSDDELSECDATRIEGDDTSETASDVAVHPKRLRRSPRLNKRTSDKGSDYFDEVQSSFLLGFCKTRKAYRSLKYTIKSVKKRVIDTEKKRYTRKEKVDSFYTELEVKKTVIAQKEGFQVEISELAKEEGSEVKGSIVSKVEGPEVKSKGSMLAEEEGSEVKGSLVAKEEGYEVKGSLVAKEEGSGLKGPTVSLEEGSGLVQMAVKDKGSGLKGSVVAMDEGSEVKGSVVAMDERSEVRSSVVAKEEGSEVKESVVAEVEGSEVKRSIVAEEEGKEEMPLPRAYSKRGRKRKASRKVRVPLFIKAIIQSTLKFYSRRP